MSDTRGIVSAAASALAPRWTVFEACRSGRYAARRQLTKTISSPGVSAPRSTSTVPSDTVGNESTDTTATTPAPVPVAPVTAPLNLNGYTYSQEGVARFLTRLAVIPELQDVKLISSAVADIQGRTVVRFSITAGIRKQTPS